MELFNASGSNLAHSGQRPLFHRQPVTPSGGKTATGLLPKASRTHAHPHYNGSVLGSVFMKKETRWSWTVMTIQELPDKLALPIFRTNQPSQQVITLGFRVLPPSQAFGSGL